MILRSAVGSSVAVEILVEIYVGYIVIQIILERGLHVAHGGPGVLACAVEKSLARVACLIVPRGLGRDFAMAWQILVVEGAREGEVDGKVHPSSVVRSVLGLQWRPDHSQVAGDLPSAAGAAIIVEELPAGRVRALEQSVD